MSKFHPFLDTSALAKRYVFLDVCIPEVITTFHRKQREGAYPASLRDSYHRAFMEDLKDQRVLIFRVSDTIVSGTDAIIKRAFRGKWAGTAGHPVKPHAGPLDALVISAAGYLGNGMSGVVLVTADRNQALVAQRSGLEVCDPESTPSRWIARRLALRPGPR